MENGSFTVTLSASVHGSAETHLTCIFIFNLLPSMLNVFPVAPLPILKPSKSPGYLVYSLTPSLPHDHTQTHTHITAVVCAKYLKVVDSKKRAALVLPSVKQHEQQDKRGLQSKSAAIDARLTSLSPCAQTRIKCEARHQPSNVSANLCMFALHTCAHLLEHECKLHDCI